MIIKCPSWIPDPLKRALLNSVGEYSEVRQRFLSQFTYDEEVSVTDLTRPIQQFWLYRLHKDKFVIDVLKDNWHSLQGSIVHFILENYALPTDLVEERQHTLMKVDDLNVLFHGCPDHYDPATKTLTDYKYTSAKSILYGTKEEYEFQLNANKYLLETRGFPVETIQNLYLFRDWNKRDKEQFEGYPEEYAKIISYEPWSRRKTENEIMEKISNLFSYRKKVLPECSSEERWNRTAKYQVFKRNKGNKEMGKRCWKSAPTLDQATALAATAEEETRIDFFPGTDTRCEDYCHANRFCKQYHALCKQREERVQQGGLVEE